jgi:hypothetical protein
MGHDNVSSAHFEQDIAVAYRTADIREWQFMAG